MIFILGLLSLYILTYLLKPSSRPDLKIFFQLERCIIKVRSYRVVSHCQSFIIIYGYVFDFLLLFRLLFFVDQITMLWAISLSCLIQWPANWRRLLLIISLISGSEPYNYESVNISFHEVYSLFSSSLRFFFPGRRILSSFRYRSGGCV